MCMLTGIATINLQTINDRKAGFVQANLVAEIHTLVTTCLEDIFHVV